MQNNLQIYFLVTFLFSFLFSSCSNNSNSSKIIVNKIVYCEYIPDGTFYVPIGENKYSQKYRVKPLKIFEITNDRLLFYKKGNWNDIESSYVCYLNNTLIEKINQGLKRIDYKNKWEDNLLDSLKFEGGDRAYGGPYNCFRIEYENRIKYYWASNFYYLKREYIDFISIFRTLEDNTELKYLKDTTVLTLEKEYIIKLCEDSTGPRVTWTFPHGEKPDEFFR